MADDKKISQLTDRPSGSLAGTDEVVLMVGSGNFRASLASLATWLSTRLTSFVTLTGIQTLTNKTLTNPIINGSAFTATGSLIDTIYSILTNTNATVENILDSIGSTGGYGIVNLTDEQEMSNKKLIFPKINSDTDVSSTSEDIDASSGWCWYSAVKTATDTKYILNAATIIAGTGTTTNTHIDHTNLFIQVAEVNSTEYSLLSTSGIKFYRDGGTQNVLDRIEIPTEIGKSYLINLKFRMRTPAGA